jgi:hypothetical protein
VPGAQAIRAAAVVSVILLVAIGWYLGSPLFIRTTVTEPVPTAPGISPAATIGATETPSSTSTTSTLRRGELQYVDALHNGKGTLFVGVTSSCCPVGDRYFLRFEDVAITNAPDVHVYLSKGRGGKWSEATSKYIGPLKATNGSFNYDVAPSDGGDYSSVVVWCRAFAVLVTWADLELVAGSPPLNRLEVKVINALATLGVTGQRAELPFENAAIWAELGSSAQLFVNAGPTGTRSGEFTVIDERQVAGTRVQRVQYASGPPPRQRVECAGDTYEVSGSVPSGFVDMDAFVAQLVHALGCGS